MTTPYTYLIKHRETGKVYYGCRYAKGCHPSEFWVNYTTSSGVVRDFVEEYGKESFDFEIRQTFESVDDCRSWETRVLKRIKAVNRTDFLNLTDNISIDPKSAARGARNRTASDKQRNAVRSTGLKNRGRKYPFNLSRSISMLGNKYSLGRTDSMETRLAKSVSKLGKPSNAVGNYQPICSCVSCGKTLTSSTIKRHFEFHHSK